MSYQQSEECGHSSDGWDEDFDDDDQEEIYDCPEQDDSTTAEPHDDEDNVEVEDIYDTPEEALEILETENNDGLQGSQKGGPPTISRSDRPILKEQQLSRMNPPTGGHPISHQKISPFQTDAPSRKPVIPPLRPDASKSVPVGGPVAYGTAECQSADHRKPTNPPVSRKPTAISARWPPPKPKNDEATENQDRVDGSDARSEKQHRVLEKLSRVIGGSTCAQGNEDNRRVNIGSGSLRMGKQVFIEGENTPVNESCPPVSRADRPIIASRNKNTVERSTKVGNTRNMFDANQGPQENYDVPPRSNKYGPSQGQASMKQGGSYKQSKRSALPSTDDEEDYIVPISGNENDMNENYQVQQDTKPSVGSTRDVWPPKDVVSISQNTTANSRPFAPPRPTAGGSFKDQRGVAAPTCPQMRGGAPIARGRTNYADIVVVPFKKPNKQAADVVTQERPCPMGQTKKSSSLIEEENYEVPEQPPVPSRSDRPATFQMKATARHNATLPVPGRNARAEEVLNEENYEIMDGNKPGQPERFPTNSSDYQMTQQTDMSHSHVTDKVTNDDVYEVAEETVPARPAVRAPIPGRVPASGRAQLLGRVQPPGMAQPPRGAHPPPGRTQHPERIQPPRRLDISQRRTLVGSNQFGGSFAPQKNTDQADELYEVADDAPPKIPPGRQGPSGGGAPRGIPQRSPSGRPEFAVQPPSNQITEQTDELYEVADDAPPQVPPARSAPSEKGAPRGIPQRSPLGRPEFAVQPPSNQITEQTDELYEVADDAPPKIPPGRQGPLGGGAPRGIPQRSSSGCHEFAVQPPSKKITEQTDELYEVADDTPPKIPPGRQGPSGGSAPRGIPQRSPSGRPEFAVQPPSNQITEQTDELYEVADDAPPQVPPGRSAPSEKGAARGIPAKAPYAGHNSSISSPTSPVQQEEFYEIADEGPSIVGPPIVPPGREIQRMPPRLPSTNSRINVKPNARQNAEEEIQEAYEVPDVEEQENYEVVDQDTCKGKNSKLQNTRRPPEGQENGTLKGAPNKRIQDSHDKILNQVLTGLTNPMAAVSKFNSKTEETNPKGNNKTKKPRPPSIRKVPPRPGSDDIPDEPILDFDELSDAIDAATLKSKQASVKKSRNGIPFPMPSVKSKEQKLEDEPWFRGNAERSEAEKLLSGIGKDGAFVVRNTTKIDGYSISIFYGGAIRHLHINRKGDKFHLGSSEQQFESVIRLVEFFMKNDIELKQGGKTRLIKARPMK